MALQDSQHIVLSRQAILVVTALGVGMLTLSYVLGVQVGKQSAAMHRPRVKSVDEELQELPEPITTQLKIFEGGDTPAPQPTPPKSEAPEVAVAAPPPAAAKPAEPAPKAEPKPTPKPAPKAPEKPTSKPAPKEAAKPPIKEAAKAPAKPTPKDAPKPAQAAKETEPRWTLQLVSTPDPKEADRVAARAKAAGYATTTVKENGQLKVRLKKAAPRTDADAAASKLKDAGFKPFAVKADAEPHR